MIFRSFLISCAFLFVLLAVVGPVPASAQATAKLDISNDTSFHSLNANKLIDSIIEKINLYGASKSAPIVFAHFDKTIYAQNENVWFTAYLLNRKNNDNPDVLSVSLVNDLDRSLVFEQKFLMAGGIGFGNVYLNDTIPPGNYSFILYPNRVIKGRPEAVFVQHITVLSTTEASFKVSLGIDMTSIDPYSRKAVLTVATKDNRPVPDAVVHYKIGSGSRIVAGHARTDNEGKYTFNIPELQKDSTNAVLETKVTLNKEVQNVSLLVPFTRRQKLSVKFYPEGGHLVHATAGWVGWEVKTGDGAPVKIHGILFRDDMPIDTIETNSYGMGKFKMIPLNGSNYAVRLLADKFRDSTFKLPQILLKSPAISIQNALTNDTLKIRLTSKYPETVTVLIHNFKQLFLAFNIDINAAGRLVRVNLKDMPKGLATATVLDSMGRPCAERIFFAHYNKRGVIGIRTDKPQYTKREKVNLSLRFLTPDTGMVSVACVQSDRLTVKNSNDIESYLYLEHEINGLPLKDHYMGYSETDKAYLENLLLIRGWRRYTWQGMMQTISKDKTDATPLVYAGNVTHLGHDLKRAERLLMVTDSLTTTVETDEKGNFIVSDTKIITNETKKVHVWVITKFPEDYKINIDDPYRPVDNFLAGSYNLSTSLTGIATDNFMPKGMEHAIMLQEVKITSMTNTLFASTYGNGKNACGDYVCRYNILNCPNHPNEKDNHPPVFGQMYHSGTGTIVYMGCVGANMPEPRRYYTFDGIKYSKEFYGSDYSIINPSQPEYYSTIFWKHLVKVDHLKDASFSFYTSDITGPIKVVVQGVTGSDVVYGEKEFDVK